jgi:hypothetical protein
MRLPVEFPTGIAPDFIAYDLVQIELYRRREYEAVVKTKIVLSWIMTPSRFVGRYRRFEVIIVRI